MENFAAWLYHFDKQIFMDLRGLFGNPFLENNSALFGNPWAWMPLFAFFGVLLILNKPNSAVFTIFFGLATFILSLQASMLMAFYFKQYSPWVIESWLHHFELPAMGASEHFSLPDWPIAACFGVFYYTRLHLHAWGRKDGRYAFLVIVLLAFVRIYAGYTYPLGALTGFLVGALIAWLMFKVARNVETIALSQPEK